MANLKYLYYGEEFSGVFLRS